MSWNWIIEHTVGAVALLLVVLLFQRVLRPRPALAHALWLVVVVKLVMPPLWGLPVLPAWGEPAPDIAPEVLALLAVSSVEPASPPAVSPVSWQAVLWIGWAVGAAACGLLGAKAARRLRRVIAHSRDASPRLASVVAEMAARLGVPVPRVRAVGGANTPFVFGALRPTLVWPESMDPATPAGRAACAHELAHLRRRDHWVAVFEVFAALALWWHPLFWYARSRMRHEAEMACDALALELEPRARRAYAGALIDALERQ